MITFLPFKSFKKSAQALDSKRLGKQRVETKQILIAIYFHELKKNIFLAEQVMPDISLLANTDYGYRHHPATIMWEYHPLALVAYGLEICEEWIARGNKCNTVQHIEAFTAFSPGVIPDQEYLEEVRPELLPPWLGDERLHQSHRSRLIQKDRMRYRDILGWQDPDNLSYFWPGRDYERVLPVNS